MNWYELNIEEPVRKIVENLRNNGINTTCSCGHEMYIECDTSDTHEDAKTIYNVLIEMGINNYNLNIYEKVIDGHRNIVMEIKLKG